MDHQFDSPPSRGPADAVSDARPRDAYSTFHPYVMSANFDGSKTSHVTQLRTLLQTPAHSFPFLYSDLIRTPDQTLATGQGFITAEAGPKGNVSISQLPPGVRLDAPWPLLKVAQQAQPHRLTYYPEARLYALTVSRQVLLRTLIYANTTFTLP